MSQNLLIGDKILWKCHVPMTFDETNISVEEGGHIMLPSYPSPALKNKKGGNIPHTTIQNGLLMINSEKKVQTYWASLKLPQIYTVIAYICIGKVA